MKRIRKKPGERDRAIVFKISGKPYAIYKLYGKVKRKQHGYGSKRAQKLIFFIHKHFKFCVGTIFLFLFFIIYSFFLLK